MDPRGAETYRGSFVPRNFSESGNKKLKGSMSTEVLHARKGKGGTMKSKLVVILFACAVIGLALLSGCNKAELAKLRTDLNQVTGDKTTCEAKLGDIEKSKAELQKQKADLESQVKTLNGDVAKLKAEADKCSKPPAAAAAPDKKEDDKKGNKKGKK